MASASGTSSESRSSGENLLQIMDQRKRKRMISNRESARRSRMRKQKLMNELTAQVGQIGEENEQIAKKVNFSGKLYMNLAAENSILRAQFLELQQRLDSLNEIISFMNLSNLCEEDDGLAAMDGSFETWSFNPFVHQPVMAVSADLFMC